MSRPPRAARLTSANVTPSAEYRPQALRPEIAQIIEALARAAVCREDRRLREAQVLKIAQSGGEMRPRTSRDAP
jgi:hypothetical protein